MRTLFAEQAFGSLEDRNFRTFDIAFEKVGSWVRQDILVERDGFDRNGIGSQANLPWRRGRGRGQERCWLSTRAKRTVVGSDHTAFSSTAACEKLL